MIVLTKREQIMELVDEKTQKKVRSSRDYVTMTADGNMLVSFRWMDHSRVITYTTVDETTLWAENTKIRGMAKEIKGTGKEELFDFILALASEDLIRLDKLDDSVVDFEEKLFDGKGLTQENFQELHNFRKDGWSKRRYFERMELLTDELMKVDSYFAFLDNKYDKLLNRILRSQEYLDQIRQAYEAQIGIEQNNLMKFFTVITSIFLPLSLIAGWYGMNLMMPEVSWAYSYPFVIALSLLIIIIMIWLFRRNKWL